MKKLFLFFALIILAIVAGCHFTGFSDEEAASTTRTLQQIRQSGELRILTLYSSTSYFLYKGAEMGYEYELAKSFAKSQNLQPIVVVASNTNQLTQMLKEGLGDVIAYPIAYNIDQENLPYKYCGNENITHQVLVQYKDPKTPLVKDVTELIGKDIYVEAESKYYMRLVNLNNELGGGISIHPITRDSLTTEDIIDMVAAGTIRYTLADDNLARVNRTFHRNIDISLEISFPQRSSWAIPADADSLKLAMDYWFRHERKTPEYAAILKRYFEKSKSQDVKLTYLLGNGHLSVYDDLYRKYAPVLGWDWRLLAALSFEESRFDPNATSWAGARGLLQLMPNTGADFGLKEELFTDPESNLNAGTKYIAFVQNCFSRISNKEERIKFTLGSFHAGVGHILDATALARKYGYADSIWEGNVAVCLQMKSNPQYYNDSILRFGYFPGNTTLDHVSNILARFEEFKTKAGK